MTDLDEEYEDDDSYDEEPYWEKDEPDCHSCMDTGIDLVHSVMGDVEKPCRWCRPSVARRLWWRLTDPARGWWIGRQMRRHAPTDNEPPF